MRAVSCLAVLLGHLLHGWPGFPQHPALGLIANWGDPGGARFLRPFGLRHRSVPDGASSRTGRFHAGPIAPAPAHLLPRRRLLGLQRRFHRPPGFPLHRPGASRLPAIFHLVHFRPVPYQQPALVAELRVLFLLLLRPDHRPAAAVPPFLLVVPGVRRAGHHVPRDEFRRAGGPFPGHRGAQPRLASRHDPDPRDFLLQAVAGAERGPLQLHSAGGAVPAFGRRLQLHAIFPLRPAHRAPALFPRQTGRKRGEKPGALSWLGDRRGLSRARPFVLEDVEADGSFDPGSPPRHSLPRFRAGLSLRKEKTGRCSAPTRG